MKGLAAVLVVLLAPRVAAQTTITGALPSTITPAWNKGIQPINQENYWNAVNCGKQGGQRPQCVFYDADVCKNDDFEMAMFTPHKQVAYQVWDAVRKKQEPPTPSYSEAGRTHYSEADLEAGGQKPFEGIALKRGAQTIEPVSKSLDAGVGNFIFDFPAFAPTSNLSIEMIGTARTVSCHIDQSVLALFR